MLSHFTDYAGKTTVAAGNYIDSWITEAKEKGNSARAMFMLRKVYYRDMNDPEIKRALRELAAKHDLGIYFTAGPAGPGKIDELAILKRQKDILTLKAKTPPLQ